MTLISDSARLSDCSSRVGAGQRENWADHRGILRLECSACTGLRETDYKDAEAALQLEEAHRLNA